MLRVSEISEGTPHSAWWQLHSSASAEREPFLVVPEAYLGKEGQKALSIQGIETISY